MTDQPKDPRIAFGVRCTWWDSIDRVGSVSLRRDPPIDFGYGIDMKTPRLPCCPTCGGMLYEVKDEATWLAGVDAHEAKTPGYRDMVLWARGRCFPDHESVRAAYESARTWAGRRGDATA